jgi:integrase
MQTQLLKVTGERSLYYKLSDDGKEKHYFLRITVKGQDTSKNLATTRKGVAVKARDDHYHAERNRDLGIQEPIAKTKGVLITAVLELYENAGYPDDDGNEREEGDHLVGERASIVQLKKYWDGKTMDAITQNSWDTYKAWRKKNARAGSECKRQVDLDRNCLSNACKWAMRKEVLKENPMTKTKRFHSYLKAVHCKEYCPETAEELHDAFKEVFREPKSEAHAWCGLFEAATGCRTDEMIHLRINAQPGEPGYVIKSPEPGRPDTVKVRRAKKAGRENELVTIAQDLRIIMDAHKIWHDRYYPGNPYAFPSIRKVGTGKPCATCRKQGLASCGHASPGVLTKRFDALFDRGILKRKYTSHAMRAYRVLCRRSWGISDMIICAEINQIGGTRTLEISYGSVHPDWLLGNGPKLTAVPSDPTRYAWAELLANP